MGKKGKGGGGGGGGKSKSVPARSSSNKDSGLPAFFRHRKIAGLPNQNQNQNQKGKRKEEIKAQNTQKQSTNSAPQTSQQDESMSISDPSPSEGFDSLVANSSSLSANDETIFGKDGEDKETIDAALAIKDSSSKAYARELRKVIDLADVLIEVLDARDPLGCRSTTTERAVLRAGKRLVFVLSKIDMVPRTNVEAWLKYLRHEAPALAFKASTQQQRSHLAHGAGSFEGSSRLGSDSSLISGSEAIGAGALLSLMKNFAKTSTGALTVGVFGAPNVGKSSLINSVARSKVCAVASTPGHTKVVQPVSIDKQLRLLDCPGVVFQDSSSDNKNAALLRNVVKVELVEDPIAPVEAILARVEPAQLSELYKLGPEGFDPNMENDFLMRLADRRGRRAGGKLDLDAAARTVLHDWNVGKIRYFTQPPTVHPSAIPSNVTSSKGNSLFSSEINADSNDLVIDNTIGSSVVTGYSEAFDLAALLGEADAEAFGGLGNSTFDEIKSSKSVPNPPERRYAKDESDIQEDQEPEIEKDNSIADLSTATNSTLGKRQRDNLDSEDEDVGEDDEEEEEEIDSDEETNDLLGGDSNGAWEARKISKNLTKAVKSKKIPLPLDSSSSSSVSTPSNPIPVPSNTNVKEPEWLERQRAKASQPNKRETNRKNLSSNGRLNELSTVFSQEELKNLAPNRGSSRKKAKKQKRREERSGAGLVNALESAMDFKKTKQGEDGNAGSDPKSLGKRKGLFDLLDQDTSSRGGKEIDQDEAL